MPTNLSMFDGDIYAGPHSDIVGETGSGKSTLAAALFRNAPGTAIYIDPSGDETVGADTVIDIPEGDSFNAEILAEETRIRIILPFGTGTEEDIRTVEILRETLFELGDNIPNESGRFFVFVDEAHEVAPLNASGTNPLVRMAKRGRSKNIRVFPVTQSPADLSKKVVKQMKYHIIFNLNDYSVDYLKRYSMPADEIKQLLGEPGNHRFVIYDGHTVNGPFRLSESAVR